MRVSDALSQIVSPDVASVHDAERQHLVEAVKDVQRIGRIGAVLLDKLQIRRPHVQADELDLAGQLRADDREELAEALGGALLANPQQSVHVLSI
jgi:uncharacterized membrane protein